MKQIKFTMTKPINLEHSNIADVKVSNPDADIRVFAGKEKKTENEEDISKIIYAGENILLPFGVKLNSPDVSDRLKLMGFNSIDEIKNIKKIYHIIIKIF